MMLTGCSSEEPLTGGTGAISVRAALSGELKVVSRADADELRSLYGESLELWLTKPGQGPIRRYQGLDNLPTENIQLHSGSYVAEAWAGDSVSASFDAKYFKGYVPFEVKAGEVTPVDVTLKIANVVTSVKIDDNVDDVVKDYSLKVGHSRGELTFEGRDDRKGFFMMPSTDTDLTLTFTATDLKGKTYTQTEVIADAQPTTEYVINIKYNPKADNGIGGAYFDIVVDRTEIDVNDEFVLTLAPDIKGVGFDINETQTIEPGQAKRMSVFVSATEELTSLIVHSDDFTPILGRNGFDIIKAGDSSYEEALKEAGVSIQRITEDGVLVSMRVSLEDAFVAALTDGVHTFEFTAGDGDLSETRTLTIDVTSAPVTTLPVAADAVGYTDVTLRASVLAQTRSRADGNGFSYRPAGTSEWKFVEGTVEGSVMTAHVTGLAANTAYEYMAVYDGYEAAVFTFRTKALPQLPNAGFEDYTDATPMLFYSGSEANMFWDSGNHGSNAMKKNVTTIDTSIKHSGSNSIMLKSQFVGVGSLGKFAAGNVFVGKYLKTDVTDGELGWGRPFTCPDGLRPKALKVYAKYSPGSCQSSVVSKAYENPAGWTAGTQDQGVIYCALMGPELVTYSDGSQWSAVVVTKKGNQTLFDRNSSNVIAFGEHVFTGATDGDGLVEITIPLVDKNPLLTLSRIVIVASASRYGDYFLGGEGSTLWLDDFELIY